MKYLTLIVIFIFSSCFQKAPPLEYTGDLFPLTLEGLNRLAFLYADDEVWVPESCNALDCRLTNRTGDRLSFEVSAGSNYELIRDINFSFSVDYQSKITYTNFYGTLYADNDSNCRRFYNEEKMFVDVVKLDTTSNIISGYFEMPVMYNGCQDSLIIREGRFDLLFFKN